MEITQPISETQPEPAGPATARPSFLRALGENDVPKWVTVNNRTFQRVEVFKHDSWAATAVYRCGKQHIVCKHNRTQPIFFCPMSWLGHYLASREHAFLRTLGDLPGIPRCYDVYDTQGRRMKNALAHDFIPGAPMSLVESLPPDFFDRLFALLGELHARNIAYIDLHKQENVIVGNDGLPHLIDFQISLQLPNRFGFRHLFRVFAGSDLYHVEKHLRQRKLTDESVCDLQRPWWIQAHRMFAVPIRKLRRRFLVQLGVRSGDGRAHTEIAPEIGLRRT